MNVLLIYPECPETFWSFKHALRFASKRAGSPPLGLLTVAAMLPKEWGKRLVDLHVRRLTEKDLQWADIAFVSGMVVQRDSAHAAIAQCKQAGLRVVGGGPLFTLAHSEFPEVDYFVLNEAEVTLAPFLADLARGEPQRMYTTAEHPPIEQTPVPLWDLADRRRYGWMSIQYSRGCPHRCDFCNVTSLLGHRVRTKTSAQILAELDALYAWGWRGSVFFVDDNFIGKKQHLKTDLLPALIEWQKGKAGIPFFTEVSIDLADDQELMNLMHEAGFHMVFIGIETPDNAALAECNKRQNVGRDLVANVKCIQRAGLQVQGGFILGFDTDTPSVFQRQIDFIQNSGVVMAMVGLLQAIPGTELYKRLKREGRLTEQPSTGDNVDGTTNILPRMGLEHLREGYRSVLDQIYSPKHYYRRLRTFLREFKTPRIHARLQWSDVLALLRSNVRLGILGRERFHYWWLLLWTCFRRADLFSYVVAMAICGHHFRKTCENRVK
ncbi:MAG: B12-binding domain-containing radical SAM protein [Planctomycetes bacterium]|nr:B12-binding domain-containing radical SAM protein [Planctomycetota bacterium]